MKRILKALLFALLAGGGCTCDESLGKLSGSVEVEPAVVDFGKVPLGASRTATLRVKNVGTFPLNVASFQTAPPFSGPTGSSTISVGSSIEVEVGFVATTLGVVEGTLTLTTDDPKVPMVTVPLIGEGIEAAVNVDPLVIDFGEVLLTANTQPQMRTVTVSNPGTDSFDLTELTLAGDGAGAFMLDPGTAVKTFGPGDADTFTVSFRPNAMGPVTGAVQITTTAPDGESITVMLLGRAVGPVFEVCAGGTGLPDLCTADGEVPRIDFAIDRNATATGYVQLLNVGDRDLMVGGTLTAMEPEITVTPDPMALGSVTIAPGEERRFDVQYAPSDYAFDNQHLALGSNAYNRSASTVRIDARVVKPLIRVNPAEINSTQNGATMPARVLVGISNCGESPLVINGITLAETMGSGAISIENLPAPGTQIAPAADCINDPPAATFDFVFDPPGNGHWTAVVTIDSNDPLNPQTTVEVAGTRN